MRNDNVHNKREFDADLRFYDDLSMMLHDIGSSRIMHIVLTRGNLSFLHQTTRYNAAPGDYIILPNAALAQDFAASGDFKALLFSLTPSIGNRLAIRSNYGIIGHLSLLQNPVMRLSQHDFERCRSDIERLFERTRDTKHYFHDEMVGHLLAAHILDLYDIHARNCLPEDFPSRAAELLRRFTEELANAVIVNTAILSGTPKSSASRRITSLKSAGAQAGAVRAISLISSPCRKLRGFFPTSIYRLRK